MDDFQKSDVMLINVAKNNLKFLIKTVLSKL